MRSAARNQRSDLDEAGDGVAGRIAGFFARRGWDWSHRDAVGCIVGICATIAILVNVLFLQAGPHPAPMVKSSLVAAAPVALKQDSLKALPRPRPPESAAVRAEPPAPARPAAEIIQDIQRELTKRSFYDGTIDGRYGPKTDAAIRDFEQATGLKASAEPSEALLRAIKGSSSRGTRTTGSTGRAAQPVRTDPIAEMLGPSKRVLAVQRALAEFGYGQIKPTGILDTETQSAIERFERERKLPVTGQVTDRVARELAAITGRPLE